MVTVLPTVGKQQSRLGLAILDPDARRHAFGLWASLHHPFLRRVRCRSGAKTLQKRQRLFPYCSLFSTYCVYFHATHFIASPRSPGVGHLPETVKHLTGSPWLLGMGLRYKAPLTPLRG